MFNNAVTVFDREEEAKLKRHNQREEERKKRIFNARERLIGIDVEALESQKQEKLRQKREQWEYERKWQEEVLRQQAVSTSHMLDEERRRRHKQQELNTFRSHCQRAESRREYDLNDPQYLQKQQPPRKSDFDLDLGASSGQIFPGEDLGKARREQRQREQQRAWLAQQTELQKKAKSADQSQHKLYNDEAKDNERYGLILESRLDRQRHQNEKLQQEFNKEMAMQKELERRLQKQATNEDNLAEIYNMLTSEMLLEEKQRNPVVKLPPSMYRGLTLEEECAYKESQRQQALENMARRNILNTEEKVRQAREKSMQAMLDAEKQQMENKRVANLRQMIDTNLVLAKEQNQRRQKETDNSRNAITEEFFNKFNTTSR